VGYIATDRLHNRHVSMAEIFFPDVRQANNESSLLKLKIMQNGEGQQ